MENVHLVNQKEKAKVFVYIYCLNIISETAFQDGSRFSLSYVIITVVRNTSPFTAANCEYYSDTLSGIAIKT
jgi:hypothetical protein